jgi:uncharacterized protein YbjT (DUF2867 family)
MTAEGTRSALLFGATGLVGAHALGLLARDERFRRVVVLTRRPLTAEDLPAKVETRVVDFEKPETFGSLEGIDAALCALGTTIKKAGSKEAFRRVDFGYTMAVAKRAREAGVGRFLVVTSMGTSPKSRLFYSRVKGELEEALKGLGFPYLGILRPSFLDGHRAEYRAAEHFAIQLGFLMPKKYKPIHGRVVAAAMIERAAAETTGVEIIESDALQDFARTLRASAENLLQARRAGR